MPCRLSPIFSLSPRLDDDLLTGAAPGEGVCPGEEAALLPQLRQPLQRPV